MIDVLEKLKIGRDTKTIVKINKLIREIKKMRDRNINIRIPKELEDRLNEFCKRTGYTKTYVIETLINKFLDEEEKQ